MKKPRSLNPVRVKDVMIKDRLRPLDEKTVVALVESIKKLGLLAPIAVRWVEDVEENEDLLLVAGYHRLEAARRLEWTFIPAYEFDDETDARLWEISENLHRAELTVQERADHISEWVKLTEEKQSAQVAPKGPIGHRPQGGINAAVRELGIDRTEAQRAVKIASIPDEVRKAADDAGLNSQTARLAIAQAPDQAAKARELAAEKAAREQAKAWENAQAKQRKALQKEDLRENRDTDKVITLTLAEGYAMSLCERYPPSDWTQLISWIQGTKPAEVIAAIRREM